MQDSLHSYMKVGLVHFMAYPTTMKGEGPILETIKKIAVDDYFDAIEVTWIKDSDVRAKASRMIHDSKLALAYGGQPRTLTTSQNINDLDPDKRAQAVENLKEGIDEAYEIGAAGFGFLSGKYDNDTIEQSYAALLDSTLQLCEHAKSKGDLKVVLEVFDYDIDKKSLIGPADLARRFALDVTAKYDNFGLMADLSHIPMIHESVQENLQPIKEFLVHAHMGNTVICDPSADNYGDTHPRFGFPKSENDVDELVEYLRALLDIGYLNKQTRPVLSFEVKPWGDEDPDIVIANAKRTLNAAWSRV